MASESTVKKSAKAKKSGAGGGQQPKYSDMIGEAITKLQQQKKRGVSKQAIVKYIVANFAVPEARVVTSHVRQSLRNGVKRGTIKQVKGTGASGSFLLEKSPTKAAARSKEAARPKAKKNVVVKKKSKKKAGGGGSSPKKAVARKATPKKESAKKISKAKKVKPAVKKPTVKPAKPKKAKAKAVKKTAAKR